MHWSIFLFVSVLVCFGLLPATLGYLDVSEGQSEEDSSSVLASAENEFPHFLRHQDRYNHHIEPDTTDLKKNLQKVNSSSFPKNNSSSTNQIYLRHHNRVGSISQPSFKSGHHLRHHNRQHESWENRVFPLLSQQHQATVNLEETTTMRPGKLNLTSTLQSRLFDRESIYTMPKARTTTGPRSRHNYGSHILPALARNRPYADDNHFDDRDESKMEHPNKHSVKNSAAIHLFSAEDYSEDDDGYQYESGEENEEQEDEESALDSERWNKIEIKDSRHRREHHPSAKRWISSDDAESIYTRHNIPGTLTQHKFEELGTHDAVKQSRKAHITNHMHKAMANAHATRVYSEAHCHLPQQRVERIQKDPSKVYVPHCTILHRCGDDTGCCKTDRQTCAAKRTQSVDLYFFVKSFDSKQGSIERHTFINHTECHCADKTKYHMHSFNDPAQIMRKATVLDCNCPKLFEKILQENGICRCDCSSGNTGCNYLKRGMEHFSMVDRKCIIEGRCKPPTCEFGNYLKKHGRCQRSSELVQQSTRSWGYN